MYLSVLNSDLVAFGIVDCSGPVCTGGALDGGFCRRNRHRHCCGTEAEPRDGISGALKARRGPVVPRGIPLVRPGVNLDMHDQDLASSCSPVLSDTSVCQPDRYRHRCGVKAEPGDGFSVALAAQRGPVVP